MLPPNQSKNGESFVILAIIFLTIFIVLVVTYSIYLFVDLTHIPSAADIHITKNFVLAAKNVQGKLYSNPANGISNWIVYSDNQNGFEIKYPNDLDLERNDKQHLISLKKISNASGQGSLSSFIYLDKKDLSDSISVKDVIKQMGLNWNENWKQQPLGGKPGIRTGEIKEESGVIKNMVIWQFGGKAFILESDCFKINCSEQNDLFEKIISEFSFT